MHVFEDASEGMKNEHSVMTERKADIILLAGNFYILLNCTGDTFQKRLKALFVKQ